jgi:hypothetical protein
MHTLVFVTASNHRGASSSAVRAYVTTVLQRDGFTDQTRFSRGWGDWFVIGGRWSGELTRRLGGSDAGGNQQDELGLDDDAQVVTPELYDACLKDFEGESEVCPMWMPNGSPGFIDLDSDDLSPETHIAHAAGKVGADDPVKWLVVVDLHS